jgi:threonylcarbamoyladenosine tRNA methylthiotransferase MtaB
MFENSLALVDDAGLSQLHVFPFSPRPGTAAAKMPQLPRPVVKERAARLRAHGEEARTRRLDAMLGSRHVVLAEKGGIGHTPCFTPVAFEGPYVRGSLVPLTITGRAGDHLIGVLQ